MQPTERRKREIEEIKKIRMDEIIEKATIIFCENGIDNTKVTDIAKAANVGVASVYRYFQTKTDIALQVGIKFWQDEAVELYDKFDSIDFQKKDGISQVEELLNTFITLYKNHKGFLRYINYLDSFIVKEQVEESKLAAYEESVISIKELVVNAIRKGQDDNTIRKEINAEEYYTVVAHALMSLTQKLVLGEILKIDHDILAEKQIEKFIDMVVFYIKNN